MTEAFDAKDYWIKRHERFRGDWRSIGNLARSSEKNKAQQRVDEQRTVRIVERLLSDLSLPTALDLACGVGRMAPLLVGMGFKYLGLDISPAAIEQAWRFCPEAKFLVADMVTYEPERQYDFVLASRVLVHLVEQADWQRGVALIGRALAPGGLCLLVDKIGEEREEVASHVVNRSRTEYEEAFSEVGLLFTDETWEAIPVDYHTVRRA